MNRQTIFVLDDDDATSTFAKDDTLPALPLPSLDDTLRRYMESLRPFGTTAELANSQRSVDEFRLGDGARLHALVAQRASADHNWVERWWEDYAYGADRRPLMPYANMHGVYPGEEIGWPQLHGHRLKVDTHLPDYHHQY